MHIPATGVRAVLAAFGGLLLCNAHGGADELPFRWRGTVKVAGIMKCTQGEGQQTIVANVSLCLQERRKILIRDSDGRLIGHISVLENDGSRCQISAGGTLTIPSPPPDKTKTTLFSASSGPTDEAAGWLYSRLVNKSPLDAALPDGAYGLHGRFSQKDGLRRQSENRYGTGADTQDVDAKFTIGYTTAFDRFNDFAGTRTNDETVTPETILKALASPAAPHPPPSTFSIGQMWGGDAARRTLTNHQMRGSADCAAPAAGLFSFQVGLEWQVGRVLDLHPVIHPVDPDWRPMGGAEENTLAVKAEITEPAGLEGKWIFTLYDVSREKGFCLNGGDDEGWDLVFEDNQPGWVRVSADDAREVLETTEPSASAEAAVRAKDYGAWGKLQAELVYEGVAYLATTPDGKDHITIPVDEDEDRIADDWESDNSVPGQDQSADEDSDPAGIGLEPGDGFTNYEEYRGFLVHGQWSSTLPFKKDLFIRDRDNLGIGHFTSLNLDVWLIDESELDDRRVVNFNRGWGTLAGQDGQKGLLLMAVNVSDIKLADGWVVDGAAYGGPGCPNVIEKVCVDPILAGSGIQTTLAHELGHAVNLPHHGSNDSHDLIARRGGLWSGALNCVMRYVPPMDYYDREGVRKYRYPGSADVQPRNEFCSQQAGTGFNAPGERLDEEGRPLPVAGDATVGACTTRIALKGYHRDGR